MKNKQIKQTNKNNWKAAPPETPGFEVLIRAIFAHISVLYSKFPPKTWQNNLSLCYWHLPPIEVRPLTKCLKCKSEQLTIVIFFV